MAKSKNHTNHNQITKAHRNGIKRIPRGTKPKTKAMSKTYRRNCRVLRRHVWERRVEAKKERLAQYYAD